MAEQYRSKVLASVHETALGMAEAGVMGKQTMKAFDEMCLTPVEDMAPERIREIRLRENADRAQRPGGSGAGGGRAARR